jgi:hypothetical protein
MSHFDSHAVSLRFYLVAATGTPGGPKSPTARARIPPRKFYAEIHRPIPIHSVLVFLRLTGRTAMDACIVLGVASLAIALLLRSAAFAQTLPAPTNTVVTINTANKFQQALASSGTARRMLRMTNNNNNGDSCWVFVGSGQASKEGGYAVLPGKEYLRYPPFVPSDAIQVTCASSSDTLDVEYQ